ncbi:unnamed protein product [Pseudo-nitzschia multistriata]|uniref:Major facilitator superfamily (MFS) profile domain-containing protein n=1 Tax=Pseudo-nitzschia multistriata TaxID=183589 RepID=A0A448Z7U7_9STRA|nr:unnamed protein product [Pseudo-nitzschia multistriata]
MPPQDPSDRATALDSVASGTSGEPDRERMDSCPDTGGRLLLPGDLERLESRRALGPEGARLLAERRRSFLVEFSEMRGPPQIALLMALLAIGFGSTIGVTPAVMADRFARLHHGYNGTVPCDGFASLDGDGEGSNVDADDPSVPLFATKPEACFLGGSDAQAAASVSNLVNNVLTFLTSSLVGSLSDELGRKGPLLIGLVMAMMPSLFLYVILHVPTMSPWWYYATSASTGLIPWMAIALSALNDVLPQEFRAAGTGLLFAGFLLGISLSPTLGLLLERKTLCLVSFAVIGVGFLMTAFWIPETLPADVAEQARKRRKEADAIDNERDGERLEESLRSPSDGLSRYLRVVYYGSRPARLLRRFLVRPFLEMSIINRNSFFRLISALALFTGMVQSGDQVLLIYYLEDQLDFDQKDVSIMFLIIGVCGILVQVFVMKPLNDAVGEKMVVVISFAAGAIDNFMYGIAHRKSTVFTALVVSSLATMSFPTISAIKANNVVDSEQGRIQGALWSVKALASGVGPVFLQWVYSRTKNDGWFGPGTMFLVAGGLFLVAVGLALALPNDKTNTSSRHGGGGSPASEALVQAGQLDEYRRLAASDSSSFEDDGDEEEEDTSTYGSL